MIVYILKSAICLTVLLAVYHLFLEKMKMHKFNRFYLLGSLAFALILPVLTIKISSETLAQAPILSKPIAVQQIPLIVQSDVKENEVVQSTTTPYDWGTPLLYFYGLITAVFIIRFVWSLLKIQVQIYKNQRRKLAGASLVLLPDETLPHSFLRYIFLNEDDYKNGRIEAQLLEHELTHVRQMHSLDIIFIEILKIVFWFNPVFIFYKKAIQLNHEFLADEAVVSRYEVSAYQYLLLEKTNLTACLPLASNLNYSLTKKRLTMMIKTTSKLKIWTARLALVPVMAVMLLSFSTKSITKVHKIKPAVSGILPVKEENPDEPAFFKGATIGIENKDAGGIYFAVQDQQKKGTQRANFSGEWRAKESISMGGNIVCSYDEGDRMLSKTMKIAEQADFLTIEVQNPSPGATLVKSQEKLIFDGKASEINNGPLRGKKFTVELSADGQTMTVNSIVHMTLAEKQEFVYVTEIWKLSNDGKSISVQTYATSTMFLFGGERSWQTVFDKVG